MKREASRRIANLTMAVRANNYDAEPALRASGVRGKLPGAPNFFFVFFQRGKTVTSVVHRSTKILLALELLLDVWHLQESMTISVQMFFLRSMPTGWYEFGVGHGASL